MILQAAEYNKKIWGMYFKDIDVDEYQDPDLKRKIMLAKMLGKSVLDNDKLAEVRSLLLFSITTSFNIIRKFH